MPAWNKHTVVADNALGAPNWIGGPWAGFRTDPYLIWAILTQFADAGGTPGKWIPIILELKEVSANAFLGQVATQAAPRGLTLPDLIQIDSIYTAPPTPLSAAKFCTAIVTKEFLELLTSLPVLLAFIERFEFAFALLPEDSVKKGPEDFTAGSTHTPATAASCVVGIIDDGIAFANERFKDASGSTRIDYLWHQGLYAPGTTTALYGREFSNTDVNAFIAAATSAAGTVDEEGVYRSVQYDEVRRRFAHGTFTLDLAAGLDPSAVTDASPRIVAVQLQSPSRRTRDRSTGWLNARTLDGLRYILDRANKIKNGVQPPVVVNLSYGLSAGPHDGSSMLEVAMDELIQLESSNNQRQLEIVIAAGNSNLRRSHLELDVKPGETQMFCWRALPDDFSPNFLEIWLPPDTAVGDVEIALVPPGMGTVPGNKIKAIQLGETYTWQPGGQALCTITSSTRVATGGRPMFLIALAPTASFDSSRELGPVGNWDIEIKNKTTTKGLKIHAWVQRDETPYTFQLFGRQSRLDDPNYISFDAYGYAADEDLAPVTGKPYHVYRKNTLNSIATGADTIVIGGFRRTDFRPARYSSSGYKSLPTGQDDVTDIAPTALTVSDDAVTARGVFASGVRSNSSVAINGTSVAAPQVVRWLATKKAVSPTTHGKAAIATMANALDPVPRPRPANLEKRIGNGRIALPALQLFESGWGPKPR